VRVGLVAAALVASGVALSWAPTPFFWVLVLWSIVLLRVMRWTARPGWRAAWFNLYLLLLGLAAIEGYFAITDAGQLDDSPHYYQGYYQPDDLLGYAPRADMRTPATRRHGDEVVYDEVYTIGPDGLRVAPPGPTGSDAPCALFFGGSFTFGEGVGDEATLPYRFGIETGGRLATRNFGFHGYGPHQMLAVLERGRVDDVTDCAPRLAIYQGMAPHVARSAGRSAWDRSGPRYVLEADGGVRLAGSFDDGGADFSHRLSALLARSAALRRWRARRVAPEDVDLYLAIVKQASERFEEKYPGATFHVLFWDEPGEPVAERVVRELRAAGLPVHGVRAILPEVEELGFSDGGLRIRARPGAIEPDGYTLGEHDGHPSAAVHAAIARQLAREIAAPAHP
jgi:hypothetical protein